tara:strand:- start:573 stop:851 length:279 start_codon:yes stop_codon:yes gene_type:complete
MTWTVHRQEDLARYLMENGQFEIAAIAWTAAAYLRETILHMFESPGGDTGRHAVGHQLAARTAHGWATYCLDMERWMHGGQQGAEPYLRVPL